MAHQVQYPAVQGPVSLVVTVAVPTFFECDSVQKFPRRWAQQPPAYAGIVMEPSLFTVPAQFLDARQVQKFPRRWAQQPNGYVVPVFVANRRRKFAQII